MTCDIAPTTFIYEISFYSFYRSTIYFWPAYSFCQFVASLVNFNFLSNVWILKLLNFFLGLQIPYIKIWAPLEPKYITNSKTKMGFYCQPISLILATHNPEHRKEIFLSPKWILKIYIKKSNYLYNIITFGWNFTDKYAFIILKCTFPLKLTNCFQKSKN